METADAAGRRGYGCASGCAPASTPASASEGTSERTPASTPKHALEFEGVSFSYGKGAPVLSDASFAIGEGELVALVGNNGSGKSTVARIAGAFLLPSSGKVRVLGQDAASAIEAKGADGALGLRRDVGFVFQNPDDQLVASIVVDEVAFGPSNLGLPREEVVERVQESLDAVGMSALMGRDVNTLSGGQKQRIAIADALAMRPRLMVLDEPTSMLDEQGRRDVRDIVAQLRLSGIATLWVTHSPEEAQLADRVLTIADGKIVPATQANPAHFPNSEESDTNTVRQAKVAARQPEAGRDSNAALIGSTTGTASAASTASPAHANTARQPANNAEPLIQFRDVSFAYTSKNERGIDIFSQSKGSRTVLEGVSLEVFPGELLAITGPNGCGKSTLLQHMNGLLAPTSGEVLVCGKPTSTREGANAARRNVGLCLQYPERSLFAQTVRDDIAFGLRNIGLDGPELEERVRETMEMLGLPYQKYAERRPFELSGGEQRKVALAGVVAMRRKVLVLDEPCSSLDAPSHDRIIDLIAKMKEAGQTIVMVTHDSRDVDLLADRIYSNL